jgi:hypothetical protein
MPSEDPGPVVQRLILGERLRGLRETAAVTLDDVEAKLKWYRGKLSKIENGTKLGINEREMTKLLDVYRASGPEATQVVQLWNEARRRAAPERVSDWAKQYIPLERAASTIRMVYGEIPGLLQTRDSARAQLSRSPVVLAADVDSMAVAREERGDRLYLPDGPQVQAVLGEEAILRRIGPPDVMRAQLRRLRDMSELPTMSLRIVPLDRGPHAALSCPFTLLRIDRTSTTIGYVETLTGAYYIKTVAAYSLAFDQVQGDALTEQDTRALLDRHIEEIH